MQNDRTVRNANPESVPAYKDVKSDVANTASFLPPRVGRKKRRDKGLPTVESRLDLARTYLEQQALLWPELLASGVIPAATQENIQLLADDLFSRYIHGTGTYSQPGLIGLLLAAGYLRFSDLNSNPNSLDQQLKNVLIRAKRENHFIPWCFISADYGVTATIANRHGYIMAKSLFCDRSGSVKCLYFDELGRASRDMLESLLLVEVIEDSGNRCIGASDGFDSKSAHAKIMLPIFAMLHSQFIDQLRAKVIRGMNFAFEKNRIIRKPALGYTREKELDQNGKEVLDQNKMPVHIRVIHKKNAEEVVQAFRRFCFEGWSPERIARDFNTRKVGDKSSWDRGSILQMLERTTYIGIEYDGMTRKVLNRVTGMIKIIKVPKEQWRRREVPEARIMEDDLFFTAERKIAEIKAAYKNKNPDGKGPSRSTVYSKLLFRPVCGFCKRELSLGQSGKHPSFCCLNGVRRYNECPLKSYKTVKIIERVLLSYLKETVFTRSFVGDTVRQANEFLVQEAQQPKPDLKPLVKKYRLLKNECARLGKIVASPDGRQLDTLLKELRSKEREMKELRKELQKLKAMTVPVPEPLTEADVLGMLNDLHGLLNKEVALAAPVLRQIFGEIYIEPSDVPCQRRPIWLAKFSINLLPVLLQISQKRQLPTTGALEFLTRRSWKFSKSATLTIKNSPIYEQIGPDVMALNSQGLSDEVIARKLGDIRPSTVRDSRLFATNGVRPKGGSTRKRTGTGIVVKYKMIADEVVYLRNVKKMHFKDIAKHLKCGEATVRRAYDFKKPEVIQFAALQGVRPRRGRSIRLKPEVYEEIRRLINLGGLSNCEIGLRCKCGANTVGRERNRMTQEKRIA